jgi:SAM-dependent methyltransferase
MDEGTLVARGQAGGAPAEARPGVSPAPAPAPMAGRHAAMRRRWDALHAVGRYCPRIPDDLLVRWTFRHLGDRGAHPRVLDLGCGAGRNALFLAREGFETWGVDLSAAAIAETRRRAAAEGLEVRAEVASIEAIAFPDAFFDAVVSYGVLCYAPLDDVARAIERVAEVLVPGGRFFCMTRADGDWRRGFGEPAGPCRWRLRGLESTPAEAEEGMEMTLLDEGTLRELLAPFSRIELDRRRLTWFGGTYLDDDWLVSAVR